jgi:hypothetical protein
MVNRCRNLLQKQSLFCVFAGVFIPLFNEALSSPWVPEISIDG